MKIIAIALIALALILIVVPSFFTCASQGKAIQLPSGKRIPMKCLWTARAEIVPGILLLAVGVLFFVSRSLASRRSLSIMTLILGVLVVLFPTVLIGVCMNPNMQCAAVMKPILLLIGIVIGVLGISATALTFMRKPQAS